jgi:hypothetical protein
MKELNKFHFLNEYNVSKGGQLLEEQLVPANIRELQIAMEQDVDLYTLLNTPAKDLPEYYRYLVQEISNDIENETLLTVIKLSLGRFARRSIFSYFSMAGSKITGFAAYMVQDNKVTEIKIFSFTPSVGSGVVLLRDLDNLLNNLVQKYDSVSWFAYRNNPANRIYQKAIEKYGGSFKEDGDEIRYYIEKTNK